MADEAILSRIQKLLALATSDNVNEAELAASKAQELLLEHNISEDELNSFSSEKNERVIEIRTKGKNARNRSNWSIALADIVARANLCSIITSGAGLIWIGKKTNLEVAQYIFDNLVNDLTRIADLEHYKYKQTTPHYAQIHGKTWKNSFYYGANQSIRERLNTNLEQLTASREDMNALVVRNDIELKEYIQKQYPYLSYNSHRFNRDRSGFAAGQAAGRSVSFRTGIGAGGSSGPKLLGRG